MYQQTLNSWRHFLLTRKRAVLIPAALCFLLAGTTAASAQDAAVVRLAYVSGGVKILQNGVVQFDKAVANMPLFNNSQVTTATDGPGRN